jgi:hypothetical protein
MKEAEEVMSDETLPGPSTADAVKVLRRLSTQDPHQRRRAFTSILAKLMLPSALTEDREAT